MWLRTHLKLYRAIRQYNREKDLDRILCADWEKAPELKAFFTDIRERLYGDENIKLQQRHAKYLALQNQINPHFLYNTLEAIRADALLTDCEDIAETTEALATFFRYTISNVQTFVTFSDELDNVENYFIIQRCRFGDKLCMQVEMENEQLLEAKMPKLILQPLVENAIVHGLEEKVDYGTVRIIVENSDKTLFLCVKDDGVGISEDQVESLNAQFSKGNTKVRSGRSGGIALQNVNSRIRLMFGDDYGVRIYSAKEVGTECCVTLPLFFRRNNC